YLNGDNTYAGATTINGGILRITTPTALGATSSGTTVNSGGTLLIDNVGTLASEPLTFNDGSTLEANGTVSIPSSITLGGGITGINFTSDASSSLTLNGSLEGATDGSANLNFNGPGTITLPINVGSTNRLQ